jgi:hypothetical protein
LNNIKCYKMIITIGKDLANRETTTYITHALNQKDAEQRLNKFVKTNPEFKNKYVYKLQTTLA